MIPNKIEWFDNKIEISYLQQVVDSAMNISQKKTKHNLHVIKCHSLL